MSEEYLTPCGEYCGTCKFLKRETKPTCAGCGAQAGRPFWVTCRVYQCAADHGVAHCGVCEAFPCDRFVDQFDPAHGQRSVFTRAGLLAYRKRAGTDKYIEVVRRLQESSG